jgi:hypothetical protein
MAPEGGMGEMKCISIWAKITQVSDVAHGPLVMLVFNIKRKKTFIRFNIKKKRMVKSLSKITKNVSLTKILK